MMTATETLEDLLRKALDRLARQERRTESLEAAILQALPTFVPIRASSAETPPEIPWPKRESAARPPAPDRLRVLEARLLEAEERLRIAARLETVGRLVAGVAHDFNNLLTIITGNADVIRAGLPTGHYLRETADTIACAALTAANITRQLVAFGCPNKPDPGPIDANLAVRAVERTLRRLTGERVALEFLPAAGLPLVCADAGQFDQVLLNLVVNARDAILEDGTVTVRTAAAMVTDDRANWPAEVPPGDFVALTVTDSGIGMTADVLARVFDPFFTTKGERGTGLGLSTVRDIVRNSGGHVEVESSPGFGTSARVFWPVYPES